MAMMAITLPAEVPIHIAKTQLTRLAVRAEAGERITITRRGKPVADLVPHVAAVKGDREENFFDRVRRIRAEKGLTAPTTYIAPDFDAPLPDSFWFADPDKFSRIDEE